MSILRNELEIYNHTEICPLFVLIFVQNLELCPKGQTVILSKFEGSNCNLSNWRTKLKISYIPNYTGILPLNHPQFCSEPQFMPQGPICNIFKVQGLNCNFHNLRDQTEFSSSSTSNPEFQQITYCYPMISNTNSPFKQNHNSKSSFLSTISQIQLNNQLPTTINP